MRINYGRCKRSEVEGGIWDQAELELGVIIVVDATEPWKQGLVRGEYVDLIGGPRGVGIFIVVEVARDRED